MEDISNSQKPQSLLNQTPIQNSGISTDKYVNPVSKKPMSLGKKIRLFVLGIILLLYIVTRYVGFCGGPSDYLCKYNTFNIKDYNLSEYFGNYVLGMRKKVAERSYCGEFPCTIRYYEWEVKFKDHYGNNQTYKINTASNFKEQITHISENMLEKEISTLISKNFSRLDTYNNRTGVELTLYSNHHDGAGNYYCSDLRPTDGINSEDFVYGNNFYPKEVNFKTFSQYNPKSSFQIFLQKNTTDSEMNDIANLLFTKSNNSLNLVFNRSGRDAYGFKDNYYFKNKPFTTKGNYYWDYCYSIIDN